MQTVVSLETLSGVSSLLTASLGYFYLCTQAIQSLNDVNVNQSKIFDPFEVDQTSELFSQQLSCPPITVSVGVNVNAKAHAVATVGVAASGMVIPPKINDFALITSLTAHR